MTLRFDNLEQLAHCSPHVRAQLEKHLGQAPLAPEAQAIAQQAARMKVQSGQRARPEQEAGRALVKWIDALVLPNGLRPGEFFYHVANGGARTATEAGILKGQGVRAGWPDYCLDLPAGRFHGLRLELKGDDGAKPPQHQLDILARLESVGFKCCVAWGFEEAQRHVVEYLDTYQRTAAAAPEGGRAAPARISANE